MNKAREYLNCRVIICGEELTNKTCGEYVSLHPNIKAQSVQMATMRSKSLKRLQCNRKYSIGEY